MEVGGPNVIGYADFRSAIRFAISPKLSMNTDIYEEEMLPFGALRQWNPLISPD